MRLPGYDKDPEKVKDGALIEWSGKNPDGSKRYCRIRPLNNHAYDKRLKAIQAPHRRQVEKDPDLAHADQLEALADTVLVEIVGWQDVDGQPIADTRANRIDMLRGGPVDTAAEMQDRDFYTDVLTAAIAQETFAREDEEAAVKI